MHQQQQTEYAVPLNLLTVTQFSERWPAFTQPALRALILNASDRLNSRGDRVPGNGLTQSGAIVRLGRRVLIHEQAFVRWIAAQQKIAAQQQRRA